VTRSSRFKQVDAFTSVPLLGNPVAVMLDADGMTDAEMQQLATWTNLSETTFVLTPTVAEADFRLRIFHPAGELAFAGHPTIGSTHAVLEAGMVTPKDGQLVMECGAGNLPLRIEGSGTTRRIFVQSPAAEVIHEFGTSVEAIEAAIGAKIVVDPPPTSIYNGPTWLFAQLESSETLAALKPDMTATARLSEDMGVTGFAVFVLREGNAEAIHIRVFAPAVAVPEDPVTGSANASLPTYLARTGLIAKTGREYVSTQGRELGRDGHVYVRVDDTERTWIGGEAVTVIDGEIRL
jgi:PhzF family phenazine biosynthesis protein